VTLIDRVRVRLIMLLWPKSLRSAVGVCANRRWVRGMADRTEVTVTYRDTTQPDGYSREELVGMLKTIRKHEREMDWKVPDTQSALDRVDDATSLIVEHTYPWCRARLLHALGGAEEQGILAEVLAEVLEGPEAAQRVFRHHLREHKWARSPAAKFPPDTEYE
jgi:hypothetical protein